VLLVATAGLLVAFQGWRSRIPFFDLLTYIDDAHQFISAGGVPEKGTLTSFGSYTPPGTTWLILPGVYLFSDPRLSESIGSATLYIGTLVGIFFLARAYLGIECAFLAAALWGLSQLGLFFANSLWPRGHPFFYVWLVYWIARWVERGNAKYLAAGIVTWGIGMYVFLEIAPAFFIIPVVWLLYRPSLRIWPLIQAGVVIAIVWSPYLQFEARRGFADLKSQVLRQGILPSNYEDFWCNPALAPKSWQTSTVPLNSELDQATGSADTIWNKFLRYVNPLLASLFLNPSLISNFRYTNIPGASSVLLLMTIMGLLVLRMRSFIRQEGKVTDRQPQWRNTLTWLWISSIFCGVSINELTVARYLSLDGVLEPSTISTIRGLQAILIISGLLVVILRNGIAIGLCRLTMIPHPGVRAAQGSERWPGVMAVSLITPWVVLLLITDTDRIQRLWWLWPLQVLTFASVVTYLPLQLRLPRPLMWIGSLILVFLVAGNPLLLSRANAWSRDGWSGSDAEEIKIVDYAASLIRSERKDRAVIGYHTYMDPFMATFNGADRRYKVGAELDVLFKYRHGIINTDRCAEGVSADDEYRIVQTSRSAGIGTTSKDHIDVPLDPRYHMLATFGPYQVFKRG